ncbi:TetR/AcrR family transcriptional regulator [Aeromicrobium sp. A1-2]|uniref:TetR/AcrR family transcriptional regulator n=1 Tax=Aeromicrobium sp. A1-2 TaxID=2107713 RepID=UPI0013C378DF|nr:TetR/AcrR family transcriptional regulator [Aeromicrobium sp. A1-2]
MRRALTGSKNTSSTTVSPESTEARIASSALRLFATKGFAASGIREIASAAGITTASLYHYMGTKEDLLVHLMRTSLERFVTVGRQSLEGLTSPAECLAALVRIHVATEGLHPLMSIVNDSEVRSLIGASKDAVMRVRDEYEALWSQTIKSGVEQGIFHVAEPSLARLALLEMCNGVAHWYVAEERLALGEVSDHFADMALALVDAQSDGKRLAVSTLGMRPASFEIGLVQRIYSEYK